MKNKKYIVTTTINPPTEALRRFASMPDWHLIVVGDLKTPHESYKELRCHYLTPDEQAKSYPEVSEILGWNSIQRRNIGFLEAYRLGAEIVATVDDDNIPTPEWGKRLFVNQDIDVHIYTTDLDVFDPLSVTNVNHLWHRGFPLAYLPQKNAVTHSGKQKRHVLVQADLWNGDPDIDAIARIALHPDVSIKLPHAPFAGSVISPFNSQNTFLSRHVLPYYAVLPGVGRFDDIFGGYILQLIFPSSVVYDIPTVVQERNKQDLVKNLADELYGYQHVRDLLQNWRQQISLAQPIPIGLPEQTLKFFEAYRSEFARMDKLFH